MPLMKHESKMISSFGIITLNNISVQSYMRLAFTEVSLIYHPSLMKDIVVN